MQSIAQLFVQRLIMSIGLLFVSFQASSAANPWYQIEVIVFQHANKAAASEPRMAAQNNSPTTLPESSWTLAEVERKLKANSRKILAHTAWHQNMIEEKALPIRIQAANTIDGTMTVTLNRYFHVATNLQLVQSGAHITESRRMRTNEIHYIDHPEFGIIIKIIQ